MIAQIKDQGRDDELKATIIARRAGVHRSFVSNHFAGQIAHAKAEIQSRFIAGLSGQTALSAASLRVEMETAKQQAREAQQADPQLEGAPGASARRGDRRRASRAQRLLRNASTTSRSQIEQLTRLAERTAPQLRDTEEELEAARRLNRTLIRERNSGATERQ